MAIRENLCTPLDVRNLSEFITTQVRDNARIVHFIQLEDPIIRAALRAVYPNGDTDFLNADGPWNGPVQLPYPEVNEASGALVQNTGTGVLADITPSTTALTELWTLTFTSETAYDVFGSVSGAQAAGATDADYDNGLIAIPSANWSGIPVATDQFLVNTYKFDPLIVSLSARMAAALTIRSVNTGVSEDVVAEGRNIGSFAQKLLKSLQQPYAKDDTGLRLGTLGARNIAPEGIAYTIDVLGNDVSPYADNERTPWVDSATGGGLAFLYGAVWSR